MKTKAKKLLFRVILPLGVVLVLLLVLYAGSHVGVRPPSGGFDKRFARVVNAQVGWNNTLEDRIPQVEIYDVMARHMLEKAGDQRARKLLFIGFDGALASAVGLQAATPGSALGQLANQGGLWLGQAGGAVPGDQKTRTAPGWTSMFTGVWADEHQIRTNGHNLSPDVHTIMHRLTEQELRVSFSFSWKAHLTASYKAEAEEYPAVFRYQSDDAGTLNSMLSAIDDGEDAVFGIFEHADHAGHSTGYSIRSSRYMQALALADADALRLIAAAEARMEQYPEDWLIIIATDHGGFWLDHFAPSLMESTIFFASNKVLF